MTDTLVVDTVGQRVVEGSMVLCGEGEPGRVTYITDPDGDMDEEGRMIGINPRVRVLWPAPEDPPIDEAVELLREITPWLLGAPGLQRFDAWAGRSQDFLKRYIDQIESQAEDFYTMSSARGPGDYDEPWICDELRVTNRK